MRTHLAFVVAVWAATLLAAFAAPARVSFRDYQIVDVSTTTTPAAKLIEALPELDVFSVDRTSMRVLANKETVAKFRSFNAAVTVHVPNVQAHLDALEPTPGHLVPWSTTSTDSPFFDTFRTYAEISTYIDQLVANNSRILTKFIAGSTYEGRTIYGVKVSTGGSGKPSVFFQALVHAREWLAPPTNLYSLTALCEDYAAGDRDVVELVNGLDWYFVPVVNIDGYLFTWSSNRYWRKNRRQNAGGSYGVDINRNWGPADTWCTSGSSTIPSSDTYCGTGPFSEPETSAMGSWIDTLPNLRAAVDFHTYGPLLLHPFQYSYTAPPEPYNGEVTRLGIEMEQAIRSVHGYPFESIQGSDLYPHSGGLIDYSYFTRGALAYTFELRGNDFVVPASDIRLSGEEAYPAVLILAENALFSKLGNKQQVKN